MLLGFLFDPSVMDTWCGCWRCGAACAATGRGRACRLQEQWSTVYDFAFVRDTLIAGMKRHLAEARAHAAAARRRAM
jgi:hypothetical protein